jgi:hypothetical protein
MSPALSLASLIGPMSSLRKVRLRRPSGGREETRGTVEAVWAMDRRPAGSFDMPQTCAFRSTQGCRRAGKAKGDVRMSHIVMEMPG